MTETAVRRFRLAIAAVVVFTSLLAISAWWKSATCGCGSSGLPWETIAITATIISGASIAAYAFFTALSHRPTD
jgi:uncharacterized membrane protein YbhN (UPF0104 family)